MQGAHELKLAISYDDVFGMRILPELFSILSQATFNFPSTLEIVKMILRICVKSLEFAKLEYTLHFFNCMKILTKRGVFQALNQSSQIVSKFSKLLTLFTPSPDTKKEIWDVAVSILLDLMFF